jgi:type I site-specific restriction-modification system R (restriction) subunit
MVNEATKRRIRERIKADQARYDDVTRRLEEAIEQYRLRVEQRSKRRLRPSALLRILPNRRRAT